MKIRELIETLKNKQHGINRDGTRIDEDKTRDKILYGNPDVECTGILTCIYSSYDVIKKASELGYNFVISHEACFWNHGDHTDWLENNETFIKKKKLLDDNGIVVWRNHDYIHSGIDIDGKWCDGIFYGVMKELGWEKYLVDDISKPLHYVIPESTVAEVADYLMDKFGLDNIRVMGNTEKKISSILISTHIMGLADNDVTKRMNDEKIDALITMECTDFTTSEYVRDSAMAGLNKTIFAIGHFNTEEPGMKYFAQYLPKMIGNDIPIQFAKVGDIYKVFTKKK